MNRVTTKSDKQEQLKYFIDITLCVLVEVQLPITMYSFTMN